MERRNKAFEGRTGGVTRRSQEGVEHMVENPLAEIFVYVGAIYYLTPSLRP